MYREDKGLTVAEMAKEFGVTELKYKRMESGASQLTVDALLAIKAADIEVPVWKNNAPAPVVIPPPVVKPVATSTRKELSERDAGFSEEARRAADYWRAFMKPYLDAGLGFMHTGEENRITMAHNNGWRYNSDGVKVVFWLTPENEKRYRENLEKVLAEKVASRPVNHPVVAAPVMTKPKPTAGKFAKWWDKWVIEGMELEDIDDDIEVVRKYQSGELEFTKEAEDRFDDCLTDILVHRAR